MPYLTESDFNAPSGELNRAITKLLIHSTNLKEDLKTVVKKYIHDQKPRYATYNDVIGALVCAGLEYSRREGKDLVKEDIIDSVINTLYFTEIASYEDKKIAEHGDVYNV